MEGYVLIADHDASTREAMRRVLEYEGLTVGEVGDGQGALDAVRAQAPDVLLLDLDLPGVGGVDVLSSVKSDPATSWMYVIVITAEGEGDREHAAALGADAYLTTPLDHRAVLSAIEGFLSEPPEGA